MYIEYKADIDKRDEKKTTQFLGSVSGFANASGGDLFIGVEAHEGLPVSLPGIDPSTIDAEMLRIRQLMGTNIEPQLVPNFQAVAVLNDRAVLVVRIPKSWSAPHGIRQDGHFHFFLRHSNGRSPMTLSELRTAFTLSGSIIERAKQFRLERIATITAAEGPWGYLNKPLAVFHLVPFGSVMEAITVDLSDASNFPLLSPLPMDHGHIPQAGVRYNVDGVLMRDTYLNWHCQLFRNGCLEYVTTAYFERGQGKDYLDAWQFQINLITVVTRFLQLQSKLGITPPITVLLSLCNVANYFLRTAEGYSQFDLRISEHQIDRDRVFLPDIVLNTFGEEPTVVLKPLFDALWNTAGLENCGFYHSNGQWNLDPSWLDSD